MATWGGLAQASGGPQPRALCASRNRGRSSAHSIRCNRGQAGSIANLTPFNVFVCDKEQLKLGRLRQSPVTQRQSPGVSPADAFKPRSTDRRRRSPGGWIRRWQQRDGHLSGGPNSRRWLLRGDITSPMRSKDVRGPSLQPTHLKRSHSPPVWGSPRQNATRAAAELIEALAASSKRSCRRGRRSRLWAGKRLFHQPDSLRAAPRSEAFRGRPARRAAIIQSKNRDARPTVTGGAGRPQSTNRIAGRGWWEPN